MNCGCSLNLGCYSPNSVIDFGFISVNDSDPYIFEIFSNGVFTTSSVIFTIGDPITLPFTFNENGETLIKIKFPEAFITANGTGSGVNYLTSTDGACCFIVTGLVTYCGPLIL